jgi:uncharacterized protein involved in type VI secretion and phage assembly
MSGEDKPDYEQAARTALRELERHAGQVIGTANVLRQALGYRQRLQIRRVAAGGKETPDATD